MLRFNLGCSDTEHPDFIGVDIWQPPWATEANFIKFDLRKKWSFAEDSSVDYIRAYDIFEHLPNKILSMNEAWRILKPGGILDIQVPHASDGDGGHCDPQHVSYWTTSDFEYYVVGVPERERFKDANGVKAAFEMIGIPSQTKHHRRYGGHVIEIHAQLKAVK